jgi:protein O-mannosyl-transferase
VLAEMPGRLAEAVAEYQAAIRLKPDFSGAHINLGNALAGMPGRQQDAIAEYEAAWHIAPDPRLLQLIARLRQGRQNP